MSHRFLSCLVVLAALDLNSSIAGRTAASEPAPTQRALVLRAMAERPGDPWPRGQAHVVLAVPGSQQPEKGYHEPGGSFSPAVGSFGVSIWVRDAAGAIRATSDSIPLNQLQQRLVWNVAASGPSIRTITPHYEAEWSCPDTGAAALRLLRKGAESDRLEFLVRSVGPAGGPVTSLAWEGGSLTINGRWTIRFDSAPVHVSLGREGDAGWTSRRTSTTRCTDDDGWGYARFELAAVPEVRMTIGDSLPSQPNQLTSRTTRSSLVLDLPDPRFADCLNAQAAHLMMGLLDRRTPPGEPTNYPLAWQRDGVAVVAGLARAGRLDAARELATYFAEHDFFGGFGAEGDAPGQGLRVLEDVASRLHDRAFDEWLWPHAARKAEFILKMAATDKAIRMPWDGPIVPINQKRDDLDLVCEAARNGLIIGRMDFGRPASYITAVSFQGLRGASALARRLGHAGDADRWEAAAGRLQSAWLAQPQWNEQRTYISGLWPTWIASPERDAYREHLRSHSDPASYAPWTYFSAAMTHQWLFLGEPDHVWTNLEWFWSQQTSPGLYTWWEGTGEENTFHLWENVRGWTKPAHVTPHYWTAGEMLTLLVDMLAYVDESKPQPELVIGAGVPRSWLARPMSVRGLPTSLGMVDWTWNGKRLETTVHGSGMPLVRPGTVFKP